MRIFQVCTECLKENQYQNSNYKNVEVNDDGTYEMECDRGHKTVMFLQNEKFEILFDMGICALLDGYKQEAVSCIHASMERFHEWCIMIFLRQNDIKFEDISKSWQYVKRQSERQLGAFYFLYLQTLKEAPERFDEKKTSFRNQVIHNGYIPKKDEAIEYSEYVYYYIRNILNKVKTHYEKSIQDVTVYKQMQRADKYLGDLKSPSMMPTGLGLYNENKDRTFEEAVKIIESTQKRIYNLTK